MRVILFLLSLAVLGQGSLLEHLALPLRLLADLPSASFSSFSDPTPPLRLLADLPSASFSSFSDPTPPAVPSAFSGLCYANFSTGLSAFGNRSKEYLPLVYDANQGGSFFMDVDIVDKQQNYSVTMLPKTTLLRASGQCHQLDRPFHGWFSWVPISHFQGYEIVDGVNCTRWYLGNLSHTNKPFVSYAAALDGSPKQFLLVAPQVKDNKFSSGFFILSWLSRIFKASEEAESPTLGPFGM
jgi:hypothetical protein